MPSPLSVASATGPYLNLTTGEQLIDAISSWWCVIHGYNHPDLNKAITTQLTQMAHVMLGGLTHDPAQKLAQKLVDITPKGLDHVFFADSGSVGCEVALKMAIQYWKNIDHPQKHQFIALKGAYHGDTLGVMAISDPEESMHHLFSDILKQHHFVSPPKGGYHANTTQVQNALSELENVLDQHHQTIAGFIVEPILQGVAGFQIYSPEYLNKAKKLCKKYNVLLIFDEIATGFGRTGPLFATHHTQIVPDIMILGKALTGGYLGLSATLSTAPIFESFLGKTGKNAFMHGPTFMGNPLACAVALKSIELFEKNTYLKRITQIETQLQEALAKFTSPQIKATRVLGAMGVIEVYDPETLNGIQDYAAKQGVWLRPFGNIVYTTPPYIITPLQLQKITQTLYNGLHSE